MKKLGVIALLLVGGYYVAANTNVWSYLTTCVRMGFAKAERQIPIEVELARIEGEVEKLDNDFQSLISRIAERQTEVKRLQKKVESADARLAGEKARIRSMNDLLKSKQEEVRFEGETFTSVELEKELKFAFDSYKRGAKQQDTDERVLKAKSDELKHSLKQLGELREKKGEYQGRIAELRATVEKLRVARTVTRDTKENSRRAKIESSLDKLEQRLETESNAVELNHKYRNERPRREPRTTDSVQWRSEVDALCNENDGSSKVAGKKN